MDEQTKTDILLIRFKTLQKTLTNLQLDLEDLIMELENENTD
jgi:hypothetical protein